MRNNTEPMPRILRNVLTLAAVMFVVGLCLAGYGAWKTFFTNGDTSVISVPVIENDARGIYKADGAFPQFPSAPKAFNKEISDYVSARLEQFKKDATENYMAQQDMLEPPAIQDQPFGLTMQWSQAQLSERYISIIIRISSYTGGANTNEEIQTFNYDLKNKKDIPLSDLFPNKPDYLSKLSATSRVQLIQHLREALESEPDMQMINEGTKPTEDNFRNFTFDGDRLTIYFPKYQVAPGAAGEQQVSIVMSQL